MRLWSPRLSVGLDRSVGRAVYALHRWAYLVSDGRVGASTPMGPVLLLTTIGRRTGRRRTKPLLFLRDGSSSYVVVASNGGRDRNPDWWWNLQSSPSCWVRDGRVGPIGLVARTPSPSEAAALWPRLHAMYDGFAHYATLTTRPLPLVVLDRMG